MANWITTTVLTSGNTFVTSFGHYDDAKAQFDLDIRSFNTTYCQIVDEEQHKVVDQWVAPYFGARFEMDR